MTSHQSSQPAFSSGRRPLGARSLTLSIGIHALALVAVFWVVPALQPEPVYYIVMEVEIVSAPPVQAPPPEEDEPPAAEDELVVETPEEPEPPVVEEEEDPLPILEEEPEPEPEPDPEPDSAETPEPLPEETPPPAETPVPAESDEEEEAEETFEELQARQEGFKAEYPEYFANILRQVNRCLRTTDNRVATVRFEIERDGRTTSFGVVRSSGRTTFDWQILEAIECAGRPDRLGPLPDDYPFEVLPITLVVSPRGGESQQSEQSEQSEMSRREGER